MKDQVLRQRKLERQWKREFVKERKEEAKKKSSPIWSLALMLFLLVAILHLRWDVILCFIKNLL